MQSPISSPSCLLGLFRRAILLALAATLMVGQASAQIDPSINPTVWKMLYGVTDAQLNSPAWLAADDDNDGVSNGDELLAGTNPFRADSNTDATSAVQNGSLLQFTFPTQSGKQYVLESCTSLATGNWTAVVPAVSVVGTGTPQTLSTPVTGTKLFYRARIQDLDTDGDGVSDWAERVLGFDPNTSHTRGAASDDKTAIKSALAVQNVVSVVATKTTGTQPADALTPATDSGTITVTRSGTLHFSTITVPLAKTGTAVPGLDYAGLPSSVTFAPGINTITLAILPLYNPAQPASSNVTVRAMPGGGYNLGNASGSVIIYPAAVPNGTGLTGNYYNVSLAQLNAGYNAANLFNPASLKVTRVDPAVDFVWTGTSPSPGVVNNTYYTVRWTGQVLPQYSEMYYFVARTDDGVKLWVNGQLIVDSWGSQGLADRTGSIKLQGGVRYDIKMEYSQYTGTAEAHLSWYSASQTKQIIPMGRLFPASVSQIPATAVSDISTIGFVGQPFNFQIVSSNQSGATSYAIDPNGSPLPPGLTLNSITGVISGTPTTAGTYQVALLVTNAFGTSGSALTIQILNAGNAVTRDLWTTGVTGPNISDIPVNNTPVSDTIASLEDTTAHPDNSAVRLRGYFTVPTTGNYYFWLAANNVAELWISNDSEPVNKVRRASVTSPGTAPRTWNAPGQTKQRSGWLSLVQGRRYYYEVLHNCGVGSASDHVSVAWFLDPNGNTPTPIANGSGLLPAHLLTAYDYPAAIIATGTLYATNMAPQGAALSTAVGTANLRVNPGRTQAVLHFTFSGLTSPRTAYHIHCDPFGTNPSQIIFDIDDADTFHPELRTTDGGYIWNLNAVGTLSATDVINAILQGKTYINIHSVNYPAGEIRGNFTLVDGSQSAPTLVADPGYPDDHGTTVGATRFLNQTTFGATPADVANVKSIGYSAWLNNQFAMSPSYMVTELMSRRSTDPSNPYLGASIQNGWWEHAVTSPDQLRQRVAFALSQILVVSDANSLSQNFQMLAVANYYDVLLDNSFGNFRDLLKSVTLSPAMGIYLDMLANNKGDLPSGRHADENYAREVMQLFSVGLNRLWPDGTAVLDSNGNLVPVYDQNVIRGMASVFTGWTYNQPLVGGRLPTNFNPPYDFTNPMLLVPTRHELWAKQILDIVVLRGADGFDLANPSAVVTGSEADPANPLFDAYGPAELETAIDSIFNHPNVGPFICRQLIQRLVTSQPSPAYLYRVVQKFNDDGTAQHVRGNLRAVVTAILLDSEARNTSTALSSTSFGKQREPILRITGAARAFPSLSNLTGTYSQSGTNVLNVTTSAPHKLAAGNATYLEFAAGLAAPGSGNYTVLATPAPTATTFSVTPSGSVGTTYNQAANSQVVTINTQSPGVGTNLYLAFASGGPVSGVYAVATTPDSSHFTINTTQAAPTVARSGAVVYPQLSAGATVTNIAGPPAISRVTVATSSPHYMGLNTPFWLRGAAGNNATIANGAYSTSGYIDPTHFTFDVAGGGLKAGNYTITAIQPLIAPQLNRSGSLKFTTSKFDMNYTNSDLSQSPLNSPSVFNFYYPDYRYPGTLAENGITTPEFQLSTDSNILNLTNAGAGMVLTTTNPNGLGLYRNGAIAIDMSPYMTAPYSVADTASITNLVNVLGDQLTGGGLSASTKSTIVSFVDNNTNFPPAAANNTRDRVRAIVHLIVVSPEFAIQR